MTWGDLFDVFELVVLDLNDVGIDLWDKPLLRARPGLWLRSAVMGLFTRPPLGFFDEPAGKDSDGNDLTRRHPMWPNRVQAHFLEPVWAALTPRSG